MGLYSGPSPVPVTHLNEWICLLFMLNLFLSSVFRLLSRLLVMCVAESPERTQDKMGISHTKGVLPESVAG